LSKAFVAIAATVLAFAVAGCSRQEADWSHTRSADSVAAYQQYLDEYPHGAHAREAQSRLKELLEEREWQRATRLDTPEAYQVYLGGHPDGAHAGQARDKLGEFLLARTPTGGDEREVPPTPPPAARHPSGTLAALAQPGVEFRVQLGAFAAGEAAARKAWQQLKSAHPAELDRLSPRIDQLERSGKTLWRLQAGPLAEAQARAACARLREAGAACTVVRG
jgi:hypothetical protein